MYPAQVKEVTTGVSKTFQILYKNEEVTVNDIFLFKVHVLVDSDKVGVKLALSKYYIVYT